MKLFKKTISVFLASVMCIPTGVISVAQAAEGETASGTYTVTVKEAAGGSMKISEESMSSSTASQDGYQLVTVGEDGNLEKADNDGTFWAFSKGDTVEIECQPDDGYSVQLFTITNATTGKVLAEKETSDNFFSFKMPGQSVAIEASFADYKTIPIVDDASDNNSDSANTETSDSQADDRKDIDASDVKDDSKGSEVKESEIEYHDVAETSEISEAEVDDVIADVVTESYIKTHVNEKYTRITDHIRVGNYMQITNTLFDGEKVSSDDTIDSIMSVIESGDASTEEKLTAVETVLGQSQATALLYNLDPDSDYLVGLVNTMYKDNDWHVQDVEFGKNSTDGLVVDGCIYDYKTGLGYFPKKLFINDTKLTEWKATNVPKAADFGPRAATLGITDSGANSVSSLLTAFINGIAYSVTNNMVLSCSHIISKFGSVDVNVTGWQKDKETFLTVYKLKEAPDNDGYVVDDVTGYRYPKSAELTMGLATSEIDGQVGLGLFTVHMNFEDNDTSTPITPPNKGKLYLYKVNQTGALKSDQSLGGAKFEVRLYEAANYSSVDECQKNAQDADIKTWYYSTAVDPSALAKFPGESEVGYIDFSQKKYLVGTSPSGLTTDDLMSSIGTLLIREVEAPKGYNLNDGGSMWEYNSKQGNPTSPREGIVIKALGGDFAVGAASKPVETNKTPSGLDNLSIVCENDSTLPYIRTEAHVDETSVHMGQAQETGQVNVHDDIWVYNFNKQEVYTLTSELRDSSGNTLQSQSWEIHTDKDSYQLPGNVKQKDINMGANGEGQFYTVTFPVDNPTQYAGSFLYFFTSMKDKEGKEVWNSDEQESDQSKEEEKVTFSLLSSEEKDSKTNDHITYADPGTVETDTETGGTGKKEKREEGKEEQPKGCKRKRQERDQEKEEKQPKGCKDQEKREDGTKRRSGKEAAIFVPRTREIREQKTMSDIIGKEGDLKKLKIRINSYKNEQDFRKNGLK